MRQPLGGVPKPGIVPKPSPSPLIFAELCGLLVQTSQEALVWDAIAKLPLTDEETDTDEISKCYSESIPPCLGYGYHDWSVVQRAIDSTREAVFGRFGASVFMTFPAARPFIRIYDRAVRKAYGDLVVMLESAARETDPTVKVKRVRCPGKVSRCVKKAKLPRGSSND